MGKKGGSWRNWGDHPSFVLLSTVATFLTIFVGIQTIIASNQRMPSTPTPTPTPILTLIPTPTLTPTLPSTLTPTPTLPSTLTPTPALPPTPTSPVILGKWVGRYTCSKGITGVTVTITEQKESSVTAKFSLYPVQENPNVRSGVAEHRGTFDSNTLSMSFPMGKWEPNQEPAPGWYPYGYEGQFDQNLQMFSGKMNGYKCTTIRLSRKDS